MLKGTFGLELCTGPQVDFRELAAEEGHDIHVGMRTPKPRVLVTCPEGHEWWVKVHGNTPPQPQHVVCPICQEGNDVLLPMIVQTETLLATGR